MRHRGTDGPRAPSGSGWYAVGPSEQTPSPRTREPRPDDRTAHHRREDLGRPRRHAGPRRPGGPRGRPPPRPRGHQPAGVHRAPRARPHGPPAGPDRRDRRPLDPDHARATCRSSTSMAAAQVRQLEDNCAEFGIPLHGIGSPSQGIVHVIGPQLGLTQPGHDHRLRRLAHQHARRVRRARVRDRHERGRDGARDPDAAPARPEDLRGPRRRPARPGRQRQGHHPGPDRADRRRRRHRATSSSTAARPSGR